MDDRMHWLDLATGQPLTREIKTRPLAADDRLLVGSYDGGAYALRLESM
jgi:hypothetical protein